MKKTTMEINFERHANCPVEIRFREFKNEQMPVPGLFCSCHSKHLKWLSLEDAYYLIDQEGIPTAPYQYKKGQKESIS